MINRAPGREAEMGCLPEEVVFDLAQLTLAVFFTGCFKVPGSDEGSNATPGFDYAQAFKLCIDLGDGICVDSQVNGELSHGWELIAYSKFPCRD